MKKEDIKIIFLGTGANGGVPQLDCRCKFCTSNKNTNHTHRLRSSILIKIGGKKLIIDCGPDFRQQLLLRGLRITDINGVVLTHLHWDHSSGLVELSSGKKLEKAIFVHDKLRSILRKHQMFKFLFENRWAKFQKRLDNLSIYFMEIPHDPKFSTFAIQIKSCDKSILIASDIAAITKDFLQLAKKVDLIIFDGTFLEKSAHWHISIKESAPILHKLKKRVIYTHINHSENSKEISSFLKKFGFDLAFDGMEMKV